MTPRSECQRSQVGLIQPVTEPKPLANPVADGVGFRAEPQCRPEHCGSARDEANFGSMSMPPRWPRRRVRRPRLRSGAAGLALLAALAHCGPARTGLGPEVSLADSAEAQAQFRALREQWISTPPDARVGL